MLPAEIYSGTKSYGEIEIFNRLKKDPATADWIVLHSLDIAEHRSQIAGEVDFVVIVPNKGVLCIEVKATNNIRRENGTWFYGKDPKGDPRGPFKQASEGMHSLRKKVIERNASLSRIVFWSGVIFPYVKFEEKSPEWHDWQVVDRARFTGHSLSYNLIAILENARAYLSASIGTRWFDSGAQEPTIEQCKLIADILRPSFEFFESPSSRTSRLTDELKKYTEEQFEALDTMNLNPRVIFQGPAGTGKTLLAIEAARRSASSGRKTLFVCFNRLLGAWIKKEMANSSNIIAGTLHSYMLSLAGIPAPDVPKSEFWDEYLPTIASEQLIEKGIPYQFDQLIVDETQDLLLPSYLEFLDLSLVGGMASGNWTFFGDFEKQAIYENSDNISKILTKRFSNIPRYSLRTNCRNSPRIAELVHLLGGLIPPYSKIRRPDNQTEPKFLTYSNLQSQTEHLTNLLSQLVNRERFSLHEIVILSSRADQDSVVNNLPAEWQEKLSSMKSSTHSNKIQFGTIHSYKGMESAVVILTDIEDVLSVSAQSLFYIGITRALDKLYILANKKVNQDISKVLLG